MYIYIYIYYVLFDNLLMLKVFFYLYNILSKKLFFLIHISVFQGNITK